MADQGLTSGDKEWIKEELRQQIGKLKEWIHEELNVQLAKNR